MKRNEHIVPLSRDHHHGLLFCWKIREGLQKKVASHRLQAYTGYFWRSHLLEHFREEEELLFVLSGDDLCERAKKEHQQLAQLVSQIETGQSDTLSFEELARQLDNHIRFEERVLFPYLEANLSPTHLAAIGDKLRSLHQTKPVDNYPDEFWEKAF